MPHKYVQMYNMEGNGDKPWAVSEIDGSALFQEGPTVAALVAAVVGTAAADC